MILSTLALSTLLLAPATAPAPADESDELARVSDSEFIFEIGDTLDGQVLKPGDTHVRSRRPGKNPTMVLIRSNFLDRLHHNAKDM
jgi:hypothetical protein